MQAKFKSTCPVCARTIARGEQIDYSRATRRAVHADCSNAKQSCPDLARMFDMAYEDQCADACGPGL